MLLAVVGKIFFTFFFLFLTLLFCGIPITGICALTFFATVEMGRMQIFGTQWFVADICLLLFLLANLTRYAIDRKYDRNWLIPISLPIIAVVLSIPFGLNPIWSLKQGVRLFLFIAGGYFVGANFTRKRCFDSLQYAIASAIIISMGFGVYAYITLAEGAPFHLQGGFFDWNYYAVFLVCVSPFALYSAKRAKTDKHAIASTCIFIALSLLTILTGSKIGAFLIGCMLIQSIATGFIPFKQLKWLLPVAIILALHWMQGDTGFLGSLYGWTSSPRFQERIQHGLTALQLFTAHPIFGVGYGQTEMHMNWAYPGISYSASSVDASLTTLLAETGLIGAFAFTGLFCYLFSSLRVSENSVREGKWLLRAAQISCITLGLSGLFYNVHLHLFTWCWMGVLYGLFSQYRKEERLDK